MHAKKMWGGRFSSSEDPLFADFNDSLPFDRELLEVDIEASLAYARALERAGLLTPKERIRVERGLRNVLAENRRNPLIIERSKAEDIHTFVEEALRKKIGDLALKLHTGRSRNDQVAADLRLYLRKKETIIELILNKLLETLADLAEKYSSVIAPGYTHLQRAQPVLFSHYLLAYGEMLLRDRQRLRNAKERVNVCPLGAGALSGTIYRINRRTLAHDLAFATVSENSMDAVSDRDFVLDFLFFSCALMVHLSRLSEDLILYNSWEFAFIQLDDSIASGSSLMPQKKNPDGLELIRAKTGRVIGHLTSLLVVLKGLPMTYNKDLQEDKEALFDTVITVENCLNMTRRVLEKIQLQPERMRDAAEKGYLNATELADYLVAKKVPFRRAHRLVGKIVLRAVELNLSLSELTLKEYRRFNPIFDKDLYQHLTLEKGLSRRKEEGGTAPATVQKALKRFRERIRS